MQEQVIQDLIELMKKSINELSVNFISKAQENLDFIKNPLSMVLEKDTPLGKQDELMDTQTFMKNIEETQALNQKILEQIQENQMPLYELNQSENMMNIIQEIAIILNQDV